MKAPRIVCVIVVVLSASIWVDSSWREMRANEPKPDAEGTNDAVAGQSKTDEANTAVGKGRIELRKARAADDPDEQREYQKTAREYFAEAREIFQADHDRYKATFDEFDKFIPRADKAKYETRERAHMMYIQAQLNLAVLIYDEAQSWGRSSVENKKLLLQAAETFDVIHARYRQMVAGLYARMWQGKCFEERDDLVKALGIYNELLGHGGEKPSPVLRNLQDQTRHFRLICLNREQRKDYQVVIHEAEGWLADNEEKVATRTGLGIQWELARARELLALKDETDAADRKRLLDEALATARAVNRHSGDYKEASSAMIERLMSALRD